MRHIQACRVRDLSGYSPFFIDGKAVGWIPRPVLPRLRDFSGVFRFFGDHVALDERLSTLEARSRAMEDVVAALHGDGFIRSIRGEMYRVSSGWTAPTLMLLDRGAVTLFGVRAYGVHLNGIVRTGEEFKMWIARRSPDKAVAPGKLDNIVAGGQPAGLSLRDNLIKEAREEAGFTAPLMRHARSAGFVSYRMEVPGGLRCDTLFVYDLEVPDQVTPRCTDGEVQEFMLWPVERVMSTLRETDDFKFNVALVLIDFGIRHGLIDPDREPDYARLFEGLRIRWPA
nr:DUF4743 domain-containing protein [Phaeovibrio sulfidiphilus]